jgi:hypothetical protein
VGFMRSLHEVRELSCKDNFSACERECARMRECKHERECVSVGGCV